MEEIIVFSEIKVLILAIIATLIFTGILKSKKISKQKAKAFFLIYIMFIISLGILYYFKEIFVVSHLFSCVWLIFSVVSILILKKLKIYETKFGLFFAFFSIFAVQLGYIAYTPFWARQHDSRDFMNYQFGGHFGYIGYIFFNNHLPTGNPTNYWCFFNPPLFYIISAIFMKIQTFFNFTIEQGLENLQILSVLYTTIFIIYVYRILKEINIRKIIIPLILFVGLSPAIVIMSGSLNNDILSIMLSTMAIFYCIKWYESDLLSDLIKIAITISLAIMTKISTAIIAVAIATIFLVKVIQNKNDIKKYVKYFSIFALISLPIGLWFPIKNLILYDIPVTYVQSVDEDNDANISKYSILERLFSVSEGQLDSVNINMSKENAEYNILLTTLKSYIVDEQIDYENNSTLKLTIPLIFICSFVILILFVVNLVYILKNYKDINNNWILFFILLFVLEIISYLKFCFDYPFTFTMNFRYIIPTLISYTAITGVACEKNSKLLIINTSVITMFVLLSIFMFTEI